MTSLSQTTPAVDTSPPVHVYGILALSILAISFAAIFIKYTQSAGMPSPVIAASRLLLSSLFVAPLVLTRYRHELRAFARRDIGLAVVAGVFLAIDFILMITSLEYVPVMIAIVILNTVPIWVALLETVFLNARPSRLVWVGLLVSLIGGLVIAISGGIGTESNNLFIGGGLALLSALSASIYLTLARNLRRKVSIFPYVWLVFGCAGMSASVMVWLMGLPLLGYPRESYVWLLLLALIPQLVGHSGMSYAIAYFSATVIAITNQAVTVTASIAAFFVFNEIPKQIEIFGSSIIIIGVLITLLAPTQKIETQTP
jgi:drug/metabolite transporter (DMT)-like permease